MSHNLLDTTSGNSSPGQALPNADDIFCAAIELPAPAERAAYIQRACGGNDQLLREVQELVEAYFQAGNFLEAPAGILTGAVDSTIQEQSGAHNRPLQAAGADWRRRLRRCLHGRAGTTGSPPRGAEGDQSGHGYQAGDGPLRGGTAGAGHDGSSQHRQSIRCRVDGHRSARTL